MYLNLVVVLLLSIWAGGSDSKELTEKEKLFNTFVKAFLACKEEFEYGDDQTKYIAHKRLRSNKTCEIEPEDQEKGVQMKEWSTCFFEKLELFDGDEYKGGLFHEICIEEDKEKVTKCEDKLKSGTIPKESMACTMIDCMNTEGVKSKYDKKKDSS